MRFVRQDKTDGQRSHSSCSHHITTNSSVWTIVISGSDVPFFQEIREPQKCGHDCCWPKPRIMASVIQMKSLNSIFRILAQLVVAGPIVVIFPWALLVGVGAISSVFRGNSPDILTTVGLGLGWVGLLGLYASIFFPLHIFQIIWVRKLVVIALVCGMAAAAAILASKGTMISIIEKGEWLPVWVFCGPAVVAIWNLHRIYKSDLKRNDIFNGNNQ